MGPESPILIAETTSTPTTICDAIGPHWCAFGLPGCTPGSNIAEPIPCRHDRGAVTMLTQGLDHVAVITNDSDRLQAFYIDMFAATVESDG